MRKAAPVRSPPRPSEGRREAGKPNTVAQRTARKPKDPPAAPSIAEIDGLLALPPEAFAAGVHEKALSVVKRALAPLTGELRAVETRAGGLARQKEHRAIKEHARAWYMAHWSQFQTARAAAEALCAYEGGDQQIKYRTARGYVKEWGFPPRP